VKVRFDVDVLISGGRYEGWRLLNDELFDVDDELFDEDDEEDDEEAVNQRLLGTWIGE